jgi:hypothetical protein
VRAAGLLSDASAHSGFLLKWRDNPRCPVKFPRIHFGFGQLSFFSSSSGIMVMGCWDGCCWCAVVNKRPQRVELAGCWLGNSLVVAYPVCCSCWQATSNKTKKKKKNVVSRQSFCFLDVKISFFACQNTPFSEKESATALNTFVPDMNGKIILKRAIRS